jgi:hypothetical protein
MACKENQYEENAMKAQGTDLAQICLRFFHYIQQLLREAHFRSVSLYCYFINTQVDFVIRKKINILASLESECKPMGIRNNR